MIRVITKRIISQKEMIKAIIKEIIRAITNKRAMIMVKAMIEVATRKSSGEAAIIIGTRKITRPRAMIKEMIRNSTETKTTKTIIITCQLKKAKQSKKIIS